MKLSNYTPAEVQAARHYAAATTLNCAAHCFDSDYGFASHVTTQDKCDYQKEHIEQAAEIIEGQHDHNFTIHQRMEVYLTGECTPLLPTIAVTGE